MSDFLETVLGEVVKLRFVPYTDKTFNTIASDIDPFVVQINPVSFSTDFSIVTDEPATTSPTNGDKKFKKAMEPEISIDFTLDATGVTSSLTSGYSNIDIVDSVDKFAKVCYNINSDTHQPPAVQIEYGGLLYKTTFKSCKINYTLFGSDGSPLRVKISAKFEVVEDDSFTFKKLRLQSPDVTHKIQMKDGQSLIGQSNIIYKRNDLFQEIAKFNGLDSFRSVSTGTLVYFPPIAK